MLTVLLAIGLILGSLADVWTAVQAPAGATALGGNMGKGESYYYSLAYQEYRGDWYGLCLDSGAQPLGPLVAELTIEQIYGEPQSQPLGVDWEPKVLWLEPGQCAWFYGVVRMDEPPPPYPTVWGVVWTWRGT